MDPDWIEQAETQLSDLMATLTEIDDPSAIEIADSLGDRLHQIRMSKEVEFEDRYATALDRFKQELGEDRCISDEDADRVFSNTLTGQIAKLHDAANDFKTEIKKAFRVHKK